MKVTVKISENEEQIFSHYLYILNRVRKGWYQKRGFLIMPELKLELFNSVVLPDIKHIQKDTLFDLISHNNPSNISTFPKSELGEYFLDIPDFSKYIANRKDLNNTKILHQISKAFEMFQHVLLGLDKIKQVEVTILPITFGTQLSFFHKLEKDTFKVLIVLRKDTPVIMITDAFISELIAYATNNKMEEDLNLWQIRESIGEFFLYHSQLTPLLDITKHHKTLEMLKDETLFDIENVNITREYLLRKDFPSVKSSQVNWGLLYKLLSNHERIVAELLYNNKNEVVTYDDIAKALYGDMDVESFSLQYFAKIIENIRKKLKQIGVINNEIFTKRNIGYLWIA